MRKKQINILCWILTPILLLSLGAYYKVSKIPDTIYVHQGQKIESSRFIKFVEEKREKASAVFQENNREKKVDISLLGMFPLKSVFIKSIPPIMVYPGGQPVGVKLNTKGVLIVALSDVETEHGKVSSPAAGKGVQIGDSIIKIDNKMMNSSEEVSRAINESDGKKLLLTLDRKGSVFEKEISPVKSQSDNLYKIGLWIRDSTAGVGTLTFYDANGKNFAALGHPITDVDTGTILKINTGQIVSSSIVSVRRGIKGNPGELRGIFVDEDKVLGEIQSNTECGVFGRTNEELVNQKFNKPMKIGLRNEIKEGPAKILTTIEGNEPKLYNIEIQKLLSQESAGPKSMIIKVTDPILLEKTGGIVQGMSGSPIIQGDKIVGAVTHVLINKPDVGYGIYIEWMLKDARVLNP